MRTTLSWFTTFAFLITSLPAAAADSAKQAELPKIDYTKIKTVGDLLSASTKMLTPEAVTFLKGKAKDVEKHPITVTQTAAGEFRVETGGMILKTSVKRNVEDSSYDVVVNARHIKFNSSTKLEEFYQQVLAALPKNSKGAGLYSVLVREAFAGPFEIATISAAITMVVMTLATNALEACEHYPAYNRQMCDKDNSNRLYYPILMQAVNFDIESMVSAMPLCPIEALKLSDCIKGAYKQFVRQNGDKMEPKMTPVQQRYFGVYKKNRANIKAAESASGAVND